jgi:hypothetical protein
VRLVADEEIAAPFFREAGCMDAEGFVGDEEHLLPVVRPKELSYGIDYFGSVGLA